MDRATDMRFGLGKLFEVTAPTGVSGAGSSGRAA
jgi:hypothetical protein